MNNRDIRLLVEVGVEHIIISKIKIPLVCNDMKMRGIIWNVSDKVGRAFRSQSGVDNVRDIIKHTLNV